MDTTRAVQIYHSLADPASEIILSLDRALRIARAGRPVAARSAEMRRVAAILAVAGATVIIDHDRGITHIDPRPRRNGGCS